MSHSPSRVFGRNTNEIFGSPGMAAALGSLGTTVGSGSRMAAGRGGRLSVARQDILRAYRCFECPPGVEHHIPIYSRQPLLPEFKGPAPDASQVVSFGARQRRPLSDLTDRPTRPARGTEANKPDGGSPELKTYNRQIDKPGGDRFGGGGRLGGRGLPKDIGEPQHGREEESTFDRFGALENWASRAPRHPGAQAVGARGGTTTFGTSSTDIEPDWTNIRNAQPHSAASWLKLDQKAAQVTAGGSAGLVGSSAGQRTSPPAHPATGIPHGAGDGSDRMASLHAAQLPPSAVPEGKPSAIPALPVQQQEWLVAQLRNRFPEGLPNEVIQRLATQLTAEAAWVERQVPAPLQQQPGIPPESQLEARLPPEQPERIPHATGLSFQQIVRQTYIGAEPQQQLGGDGRRTGEPVSPASRHFEAIPPVSQPPPQQPPAAPSIDLPAHKRIVRWSDRRPLFIVSIGSVAAGLEQEFVIALGNAQLATNTHQQRLSLEPYERHVASVYSELLDTRDVTLPTPLSEALNVDENTSLALWPTFRELFQASSKHLAELDAWESSLTQPLPAKEEWEPAQQPVEPPHRQSSLVALPPAPVAAAQALPRPLSPPPSAIQRPSAALPAFPLEWEYLDPQHTVRGPFSQSRMSEWWQRNYFPDTLPIRCDRSQPFIPLSTWYPPELQHQFQPFRDPPPVVPVARGQQQQQQTASPPSQPPAEEAYSHQPPVVEERQPSQQQPEPQQFTTTAVKRQPPEPVALPPTPAPKPSVDVAPPTRPVAAPPRATRVPPSQQPSARTTAVQTSLESPKLQPYVRVPAAAVEPGPVEPAELAAPLVETPEPKGYVIPRTGSLDGVPVVAPGTQPVWKNVPDPASLQQPVVDEGALGPSLAESRLADNAKGAAALAGKKSGKKQSQRPGKKQSLMEIISEQRMQAAQQPVWGNVPRVPPQKGSVWHDAVGRSSFTDQSGSPTIAASAKEQVPSSVPAPTGKKTTVVAAPATSAESEAAKFQVAQTEEAPIKPEKVEPAAPVAPRPAPKQQQERKQQQPAAGPPSGRHPVGLTPLPEPAPAIAARAPVEAAPGGNLPTADEWAGLCAHHGLKLDSAFAEILTECTSQAEMCSLLKDNLPNADLSSIDAFVEDVWSAVKNPFRPVKKGLSLNASRGGAGRKRGSKRR